MKIGIVGMGVVGRAHKELFPEAIEYDIGIGSKEEINSCEIVFVCVPTPTIEGKQNISIVEEVMEWIEAPIIVLKSTVLPGTTRKLIKKTRKNILFSPELLRQATAKEDIKITPIIICGPKEDADKVAEAYGRKYTHYDKHEYGELIKYALNSYLALKVSFFNQIYDLCRKHQLDYELVRLGILQDKRIGESHTGIIPERGFGGGCFPKDTEALVGKYKNRVSIIKAAIKYNKKVRNEH